mgnify:CR=1 FL=1
MGKQAKFLASLALASFVLGSMFFFIFEKGHNPNVNNIFDAIWWWVVTSATVGYGDIVPITSQGRMVAICSILVGVFVYTNIFAYIAQSVMLALEKRQKGLVPLELSDHIVICEYTAPADELIQSLPYCSGFENKKIVIVTDLVNVNPYPAHEFVYGVPINPVILKKACVQNASDVFIFANMRFTDPDIKTVHVASRVLKLNPKARIFLEVINKNHDLLKHLPGNIVPISSSELLIDVLHNAKMDPNEWFKKQTTT